MSIITPPGGGNVPETVTGSSPLPRQSPTPTTTAAAATSATTTPSTSGTLGTVVNTTT